MSSQATTGGTTLGAVLGLGTASGAGAGGGQAFAAEAGRALAATGASATLWFVAIATVLVVMGMLLLGLARRHEGLAPAGLAACPSHPT